MGIEKLQLVVQVHTMVALILVLQQVLKYMLFFLVK